MHETIRLIGEAITNGSKYLPIRNHAAALATLAGPKDYLGQVRSVYQDAIKRWRYVNDPFGVELLSYGPETLWKLVLAGDGVGVGAGLGAGDCDCIAAAVGAELMAQGRPVRISVTSAPFDGPGNRFRHVFVQALVPKVGWVTVDPVGHPAHGFGYTPRHSRIAYYDLAGNLLGYKGNVVGLSGNERRESMNPKETQWTDYGMGGVETNSITEPEDWRMYGLSTWGAYADTMGIMDGDLLGFGAEVDLNLYGNRVLARTPMIELTPKDYRYVSVMKRPYDGMMGLGDDGTVYEFDGNLGFFKKLFRRAKKAVKKVAKRVRRGVRRVLKKIPGGKYLIKLGQKVYKTASKFVKPLLKYVGKYAAKVAPIAALIPGYGPAIAGALYTAGKVAQLMTQYGVKLKGAAGKVRSLAFPRDARKAKNFQKALIQQARKEMLKRKKVRGRRSPSRRRSSRRSISPAAARSMAARRALMMRRMMAARFRR